MHRLTLASILCLALVAGAGSARADVPTSPAGDVDAAQSGLPAKVVLRAREFRGNPISLGVLTGVILLTALGLGIYTVMLVYRQPDSDTER
jgi:hypothetical protein